MRENTLLYFPLVYNCIYYLKINAISSHAMHYYDKKYTLNLDAEN